MFTGMVDHCASIQAIEPVGDGLRLAIQTQFFDLVLGESIAVDGACLTVTDIQQNTFYCDISQETLRLTTMADYQINQPVNLERALRVGDRLGGHWVTGHIDQTAIVQQVIEHQDYREIIFHQINSENINYLIKKGSIAVNGVSLTINQVFADGFSVMLIPHTLEITNLSNLTPNKKVNIEFDQMAKFAVCAIARNEP